MKISKYTFLFDRDREKFYTYNTLSNALIEIDEESYRLLTDARKGRKEIAKADMDEELYDALEEKYFIVENDLDSFLVYKSIITAQRAGKAGMHMTIAPTMDCSFNCHYCFEKYKEKNYMTEEVMDSIIKYLNSLETKPELRLTWFGGEPLMALPQMEQFYDKLVEGYKKPTSSNVITTGFHIDEEAIRILKKIEVSQMQITLDGKRETHNSIKFTEGCDDAFSKVLDNVELLLGTSDIHVVFRVNLTQLNAHEYVDLYNLLVQRFSKHKNFGVSPAFVMDRGASNDANDPTTFFTHEEAAKFILDLYETHKIHSPFLRYPDRFFHECAIRNPMAMSFDPEGYAYKCWEVIGNKEYAIGKLNGEGALENVNAIVWNRQMYGADPLEDKTCSACSYLPVCNGGCPIQRIENVFEGKHNCNCSFNKGRIDEFLKIHLAIKEASAAKQS